jgi:hypothetical protein
MRVVDTGSCLIVTLILSSGCGPSVGRTYKVSGTVLLAGQPLPEGEIRWYSLEDDRAAPEGGTIKDGRFELRASEGKNRVEIRAFREVPGSAQGPMSPPVRKQYLPACYNTNSELVRQVAATDSNQFEFALQDSKE